MLYAENSHSSSLPLEILLALTGISCRRGLTVSLRRITENISAQFMTQKLPEMPVSLLPSQRREGTSAQASAGFLGARRHYNVCLFKKAIPIYQIVEIFKASPLFAFVPLTGLAHPGLRYCPSTERQTARQNQKGAKPNT